MFRKADSRWHQKLNRLFTIQASRAERRRERRILLHVEELETRALLSASALTPDVVPSSSAASPTSAFQPMLNIIPQGSPGPSGFTPAQITQAYSVGTQYNGAGERVAIVDASYDPTILSDAAQFSAQFGLPQFNGKGQPGLTVVGIDSNGAKVNPNTLPTDVNWAMETALDVEWVHAIAPNASITLVEVPLSTNYNTQLQDLMYGEQYAGSVARVVSNSWGTSEFVGESNYDSYFTSPNNNVTFIAAAGDSSALYGPIWPATSPYVLAVGGTSLTVNSVGGQTSYQGESGWTYGGGGYGAGEGEPLYQQSTLGTTNARMTPDVSMVADPATGVAIYDSYQQSNPWVQVGGTSVGSPIWAGVVALADQQRIYSGHTTLDTYQVETTLYNTLHNSTTYNSVFHDVTNGYNGFYANSGYDLNTGLGTPKVSALDALLAHTTVSSSIPSNFIHGTGTGAFPGGGGGGSSSTTTFATSGFARMGSTPGSGLYTDSGSTSITGSSSTALGSSGSTGVASAPVTANLLAAVNLPVNPAGVASAVLTLNDSVFASLASTSTTTQTAQSSGVNLSSTLAAPLAPSTTTFGASGWAGSSLSWRLSNMDLASPVPESAADDSGESGASDQGSKSSAKSDDLAGDTILLETPPPIVAEGECGDGEGGEGDGGE